MLAHNAEGAWNVVERFFTYPAQITAPDPLNVVFDLDGAFNSIYLEQVDFYKVSRAAS